VNSLPAGYRALVFGASGAIGGALLRALAADARCGAVLGLSRSAPPVAHGAVAPPPDTLRVDLADEATLSTAAAALRGAAPWHLLVVATGALQPGGRAPEKRLADLEPGALAQAYAVNAIGPALVVKHFHEQLAPKDRALLAVLSARVGSIGDNRKGGWYGYRAAKAGLNMLLRCAAIEVARRRPQAVLVALHPGTVRSALTAPIIGSGPEVEAVAPEAAARNLLAVLDALPAEGASGSFLAWDGQAIPW
jgi:NAD(P)-dependent dehydrogenase (short-subunit alcohol dehydrogenase family)